MIYLKIHFKERNGKRYNKKKEDNKIFVYSLQKCTDKHFMKWNLERIVNIFFVMNTILNDRIKAKKIKSPFLFNALIKNLHLPPTIIKCQEGSVPNMSPLICRIPHCSVKILFKRKCCQGERGWTMLRDAGKRCLWKPMLIMIHWTRPSNVLGAFLPLCLPLSFSLLTPDHPTAGVEGEKG